MSVIPKHLLVTHSRRTSSFTVFQEGSIEMKSVTEIKKAIGRKLKMIMRLRYTCI